MKRIVTLLFAACLLLGVASQAAAFEITASGQFIEQFGFNENISGNSAVPFSDEPADHFYARQRVRLQVEFKASDTLKGVMQFQYGFGSANWGSEQAQLDGVSAGRTNNNSMYVRRMYIDWMFPGTCLNFKIGLQEMGLPSFIGNNPVFSSRVAAVAANFGVADGIDITAFWARPFKDMTGVDDFKYNDTDLFGVVVGLDFGMVNLKPYFVYGNIGNNSGFWDYRLGGANTTFGSNGWDIFAGGDNDQTSDLYIAGIAAQVKPIENLTLKGDFIWGMTSNNSRENNWGAETNGWFIELAADYQLPFGTLGVLAWYASGDDSGDVKKAKFGRVPVISNDNGWAPARIAFGGAYAIGLDSTVNKSGMGTWGAGINFRDFSFIENVKHTARFVYFEGTNDKGAGETLSGMAAGGRVRTFTSDFIYMTTKDYAFEIDLDTTWKIYDNLNAIIELGYVYLDMDSKVWGKGTYAEDYIWNAALTLEYKF